MAVLAMFPLGSVLLPGELLPLQVFEPRYRQLVIDLLADDVNDPEFGVPLIERGSEVGGGDHRTDIGTVARIVGLEALEGGRYAVVALGVRRFRVRAWLPDDPYPVADVDDWPETVDDPSSVMLQIAASQMRVEATRRRAMELGALTPPVGSADVDDSGVGRDADPTTIGDLGDDPVLASYRLVSWSPLGAADRHRLLAASDPLERLELLDAALDDVDAVLRFRSG